MYDDAYISPQQHRLLLTALFLTAVLVVCLPGAVLGLHYQCLLSRTTGIQCPFCGMTRDFVLMSKGLLPRNNPGSFFVALAGYVVYPVWILAARLRGGSFPLIDREKSIRFLFAAMLTLGLCNNIFR